jgi:histidine triad (HIT) family protein
MIIKGEIPSYEVYEDEYTYAFLDIHPISVGHTLVVPKKQVVSLWDMEDEDYARLQASVKKVARHLRQVLKVPYVGVQVVGVDVPHAHVHLVPFTDVSEYHNRPDPNSGPSHDEMVALAAKLMF